MARTGSRACLTALLLGLVPSLASAQGNEPTLELIDPQVLRVCADPHNLPFSNEQGEGFENKLAQATGFVRNTLGAHKCDVIMGFPQGDELVQNTNAYYRTAYALVFKPGTGLDEVTQLSDERLKGKRIGIVAGTPAATYLAINGLMGRARPYQLMVDTRVESSAVSMIGDLEKGEIDAGVLWGPMAGFYGRKANLRVVPLVKEAGGPRTVYRITMGLRAADQNWKRTLNRFIQESQADISKILLGYGVPLLDERDQPITEQNLSTRP
jgi:quinoprotein dehydrogenase-associated probable ABC transporter substrate-binding protein